MTFNTYFVNVEVLQSLISEDSKKSLINAVARFDPGNYTTRLHRENVFNSVIQELVFKSSINSIQETIIKEEIKENTIIYYEGKTRFKGMAIALKNKQDLHKRYVNFTAEITGLDWNAKLIGNFNVNHVTNDSAFTNLQNYNDVSIIARVNSISENQIDVRPIVIAERHEHPINQERAYLNSSFRYRVDPEEIFPKMISIEKSDFNIGEMESYPEDHIKKFFAEILNEGNIPNDWGGEKSDLFTTKVMLNGKRYNGAFAFKGPAKFHKLTIAHMGKNGDQGLRLFDEPADICFIQHCHYIDPNVIRLVEALAATRNKLYCVIDGIDTLRILKGYKKI